MYFLHSPVTSFLVGTYILHSSTLSLDTLSIRFTLNMSDSISYILFNCMIVHRVFCVRHFMCSVCDVSCVLCATFHVFCVRRFMCSVWDVSCVLCAMFHVFCARRFMCSVCDVSCVLCATFHVFCVRHFRSWSNFYRNLWIGFFLVCFLFHTVSHTNTHTHTHTCIYILYIKHMFIQLYLHCLVEVTENFTRLGIFTC